jgi:hypothetical protein
MKKAHIIYCRSHTIGGFIIRNREDAAKRRWSHSGILVKIDEQDPSTWIVWEARAFHKFGFVPFHEFLDRYTEYEIVSYKVKDLSAGYNYLTKMMGTSYPITTILGLAIGVHFDHPGKVHCQEAVENYLKECECFPRWRSGFHMITPNAGYNNRSGEYIK